MTSSSTSRGLSRSMFMLSSLGALTRMNSSPLWASRPRMWPVSSTLARSKIFVVMVGSLLVLFVGGLAFGLALDAERAFDLGLGALDLVLGPRVDLRVQSVE